MILPIYHLDYRKYDNYTLIITKMYVFEYAIQIVSKSLGQHIPISILVLTCHQVSLDTYTIKSSLL